VAARLIWAAVTALLGGALLWRRLRTASSDRWELQLSWILRAVTVALCLFWAAVWLGLAWVRLRFPFELEWIGGAMRDHCLQVLQGKPLYVPPGAGWFPYEYPPLYFWVCALLMRFLGASFVPMRLVSILSTLGCVGLTVAWVRRKIGNGREAAEAKEPGGREYRPGSAWGWIAAGVFLATYRFTGAWYDAERLDMLFLFLSLLGVYWLELATEDARRSVMFGALSALAFGLAFLTKQQAVLFLAAGAAALAWRRDGKTLVTFLFVALVVCIGSVQALNRATDGWFGYYCFHVPLSNGIQLPLARMFLVEDLPLYLPLIALLALVAVWQWRPQGQEGAERGRDAVLIAMTAAGVLGSLLSRAHWGGAENVLMTAYLFIAAAASVVAGRLEARAEMPSWPLYVLALAQLLTLTYRPDQQLPRTANRAAGEAYQAAIRRLEREGEVLCLDHGGLTATPHFQIMGLLDVMHTEKRLPPGLIEALHAHRYAAIVTDAKPEGGDVFGEVRKEYDVSECLHMTQPWVITGFLTPGPDRPVWVLRPHR